MAALSQPLDLIIAEVALTRIPGIGDAIADIVRKLYETGTHPRLEELREEVPAGVVELFAVPGLRPDKILKLHQALGVNSLADLEAAAKSDRIRPLDLRSMLACEDTNRGVAVPDHRLLTLNRAYLLRTKS